MASQHDVTNGNGTAALAEMTVATGKEALPATRCLELYRIMVRTRFMEERMIKMSKSGEGYFWIGGPGEEAFNACLGLQVKKGQGPASDFLHLHYRNSATLVAMGMSLADGIRQMAMTATDIHSMGRNFPGHYANANWNIVPISSVIEVQHAMAPGTALVQKRLGGDSITIVTGGDAGTAEGDFASCLIWSTRPGSEVPLLIIVNNNGWGISTPASEVHGEQRIIDRGKAFGIPGEIVDGNDPVASWHALQRAIGYCRTKRRPFMLEARVSRLFGHSSSSGAPRDRSAADCIELFEQRLLKAGILEPADVERVREEARLEIVEAMELIASEPRPTTEDINRHTYAPSPVDAVYPEDYTGLPHG
jgi:2-oxoisovalerate dehydrogenase E1 component alpha subunit